MIALPLQVKVLHQLGRALDFREQRRHRLPFTGQFFSGERVDCS
jgi:hypothetical protein